MAIYLPSPRKTLHISLLLGIWKRRKILRTEIHILFRNKQLRSGRRVTRCSPHVWPANCFIEGG
jgi:hypothetical protein